MSNKPKITRELLYKNSGYNYLTVDDYGTAILHYVEPKKVNGRWVHLGDTYGESLTLTLDGLYDTGYSNKYIKRYEMHDYDIESFWYDIKSKSYVIVKESEYEYDSCIGFKLYDIRYKEMKFFSVNEMYVSLIEPLIVDTIVAGKYWDNDFGETFLITNVRKSGKNIIKHITMVSENSSRLTITIDMLLCGYLPSRKKTVEVDVMDNGMCCKDCVMVGDIYMSANEPYRVTGIGMRQSVNVFNGYTRNKSVIEFIDFKRMFNKFDLNSLVVGDNYTSVYGGDNTYKIKKIDTYNGYSVLLEPKDGNKVNYDLLSFLSGYKIKV